MKAGEIGKVLVRGPQLFAGYLNEAHNHGAWVAPAEDDEGGARWFDTGDLGRIDEDGYVWLTGRAKDLIIRSAHNIDPAMIEEVFYRHPAVESVAARRSPGRLRRRTAGRVRAAEGGRFGRTRRVAGIRAPAHFRARRCAGGSAHPAADAADRRRQDLQAGAARNRRQARVGAWR